MKKTLLFLLIIPSLIIVSCKKDSNKKNNPLGDSFPTALNKIITPAIVADLKSHGLVINGGLTPPVINGIYYLSPDSCIYDNSGIDATGEIFNPYKLRFSNQNNGASSIAFDYKSAADEEDFGSDANATFITGTNNAFTVFTQTTGQESGISHTDLIVVSGSIQNGGIHNLQLSTYLVSKSTDTQNYLEPVGSTRIFTDMDGISETLNTFSITKPIQQLRPSLMQAFVR